MKETDKNGIWVIGDVHGEFDKLMCLIDKLPKDAKLCFVGDLVDRGKKSFEVVDFVLQNNHDCVMGNHEIMMAESASNRFQQQIWKSHGGSKTIKSYWRNGIDNLIKHQILLRRLPYYMYYEIDGYKPLVVSHSYIHHVWYDKGDDNSDEDRTNDILWRYFDRQDLSQKEKEIKNHIFNIFGHTVIDEPIITDTHTMIDTGSGYENGKLSTLHYPSLVVVQVD